MKPGTLVKMSETIKQALIKNDCGDHVKEFEHCIGITGQHMEWPIGNKWPEIDVYWQPSNLRYGYDPERDLIELKWGWLRRNWFFLCNRFRRELYRLGW